MFERRSGWEIRGHHPKHHGMSEMADFFRRWIGNITYIVFSWVIRPILVASFILGLAAACIVVFVQFFSGLQPVFALVGILAFASSLVALFLTIIEDGAPPTRWP
jgi:hypothetical protein